MNNMEEYTYMIESADGKQIKRLIALQTKSKVRDEQQMFVAEGLRMCREIPDELLIKAYISESFYKKIKEGNGDGGELPEDFFDNKDYEIVSDKVFEKVSKTMTPQGILTVAKQPHYSFEKMIDEGKKTILFVEDIRDPGNLGTIIRTAEGADVDGIVMSKGTVDIFNPKVIRSTMGAIFRVPFVYVDDIKDSIVRAKKEKISFYAAHLKGENDYAAIKYDKRCAVLIGNEARGLSDEVSKLADSLVKIPMTGQVESLNASIAAAVFMYEIYRQRRF